MLSCAVMSAQRCRDWLTEFDDASNCVHVVPIDDLKPHSMTTDCDCQPELETMDDYLADLLIHNAYDKRELN